MDPLFITKILSKMQEKSQTILSILSMHITKFRAYRFLEISEKTGTEHDEESSKTILNILDMRPTSVKKHEWDFANMLPISSTKHKMTFLNLGIWVISGSIFWKAQWAPNTNT